MEPCGFIHYLQQAMVEDERPWLFAKGEKLPIPSGMAFIRCYWENQMAREAGTHRGLHMKLRIIEVGIQPAVGAQFLMTPLLDDVPMVQHDNAINMLKGGETVSNN